MKKVIRSYTGSAGHLYWLLTGRVHPKQRDLLWSLLSQMEDMEAEEVKKEEKEVEELEEITKS